MANHSIGIILLAAGESARLGEPKQLLRFRGETLLRRSTKIASSVSENCVAVLGANFEILKNEIIDLPVEIVENKNWKSGMSSSIQCGLAKLLAEKSDLQAIVLMVCDQPFADENLFEKLIAKFRTTEAPIVASRYSDTLGVPALFHRSLFSELLALDAQRGAKRLIKKYESQVEYVLFSEGEFDIDTQSDYEQLTENFK